MQISYTEELEPLGTMGTLSLIRDEPDETFLMPNGDAITDFNINDLIAVHREK
jgi:NDP-sugar pyrophosphorylase family protein